MTSARISAPHTTAQSRTLPAALAIVEVIVILGVWAVLISELLNLDDTRCRTLPVATPGLRFVGVAIAGLVIGRYAGALRFFAAHPSAPDSRRNVGSVILGRAALAFLFLILVVIFVYEAIGVYEPVTGAEPITYYVRCAIAIDNTLAGGFRTMAVLFVVGFLFGNWLWAWHPDKTSRGAE